VEGSSAVRGSRLCHSVADARGLSRRSLAVVGVSISHDLSLRGSGHYSPSLSSPWDSPVGLSALEGNPPTASGTPAKLVLGRKA